MADVLQIDHLAKSFAAVRALDDVCLTVPEGSVFGLIGENGAGKTTTMKIVLGLLRPDAGEVHVCGQLVHFGRAATNRLVGYLPDVPQFYDFMTADEYLALCGQLAGMTSVAIKRRRGELLELVGLKSVKKRIGTYSRGMKQRLGVAQALFASPKLLLCDEPTSALDPAGRKAVLDVLRRITSETTVVFSTHVLSDVERICDRAAVLHQGRIVLDGTLQQLKARHGATGVNVEFANPDDAAQFAAMIAPELVEHRSPTELTLRTTAAQFELWVLGLLSNAGIVPVRFEVVEPTVESLFLEALT